MGCSPRGGKSRTWLSDFFHFSVSCIGEGNGNPLQCSCLENPRDRGAWWASVYGVAQSRTQLKQLSNLAVAGKDLGGNFKWVLRVGLTGKETFLRKDLIEQEKGKGKGTLANNEHCPQPWVSPVQKDSTVLSPGSQVLQRNPFTQSCLTLCNPMDCSPPGSSILGILQARILEWVAISFSRGSSRPRDWTCASRVAGRRFHLWATREDFN